MAVHDSSCVVHSGTYFPMNAPKAEADATVQRDYGKADVGAQSADEQVTELRPSLGDSASRNRFRPQAWAGVLAPGAKEKPSSSSTGV